MTTHAYLPLYVDDYEAATAHLSAEEDGVYTRLLRLCWRTPGCSLPVDDAWIARKIRVSPEDFARLAKPILGEFFKVLRGRYVQKRLKAEYDSISRKKTARVKGGSAGGRQKALNAKGKEPSKGSVLLGDTRAFPEPTPEPDTPVDKSTDAVRVVVDHDRDAWTAAVGILTERGVLTEKAARAFFGKLLSVNRIEARDLAPSLASALVNGTGDPQAYLTKSAQAVARRRSPDQPQKRQAWV